MTDITNRLREYGARDNCDLHDDRIEAAEEIERLRKILEKVDQYTPVADSTCDEPGITFTEAIMRQWPELRQPSP